MLKYLNLLAMTAALAACGKTPSDNPAPQATNTDTAVALDRLGINTYKGFSGGLYPNGSNTPPATHAQEGLRRASLIQPIDGKIVLISIGMSNTTQEWCQASGFTNCNSWSFTGKAAADPAVNHTTLQIVNGARGGQAAPSWTSATSPEYDRIRDQVLAAQGLTEKQVQVAWVKLANAGPTRTLPASDADAYRLRQQVDTIVRTLRQRYPNLQMIFLSSRVYAGYAASNLNPEPYAYEGGFAMKWAIEDQIKSGSYAGAAWLGWGPYLWDPSWVQADYVSDGTHPSNSGQAKVADKLLQFFKSSEFTKSWFLAH